MQTVQKPETPPMTVVELREFIKSETDINEASLVADEMLTWYSQNTHLLTIGEDYAFNRTIQALIVKCDDLRKLMVHS